MGREFGYDLRMDGHFLYFGYGSNMLHERLKKRCVSAKRAGLATVPGSALGFSKRSFDKSGKGMLRAKGASDQEVLGALYWLKDDADELKELHDAEGLGNGYDYVAEFQVKRWPEGTTEIVKAYQVAPSHLDVSLKPYDWYLGLVVAGAIQCGFPDEYADWLRGTEFITDPPAALTERNRAKLEENKQEAIAVLEVAGFGSIKSVLKI